MRHQRSHIGPQRFYGHVAEVLVGATARAMIVSDHRAPCVLSNNVGEVIFNESFHLVE